MDYTGFVDREEELAYLGQVLDAKGFQLVPVWGRRRVGKTTLLVRALEGKGIYFLASEEADIENIRRFREDTARSLGDPSILDIKPEWEAIFRWISSRKVAVVLDEFPYLVSSNPAIPSIFQRIVDLVLKESDVKLFLCGSSVRMMESQVLDYRAPLYGRRTGQVHLKPLRFAHLPGFFPDYPVDDLVRVYGACGGVPLYLSEFGPEAPFWSNVEDRMLNPRSLLYSEADFLLRQEFTQLATYRSVLRAIASGRTRMEEIRTALDIGKSDISPYLKNLASVGLVSREVPVTERSERSRRGIYRICDNYMNFHFRYILPHGSLIESGGTEGALVHIKADYDAYLGPIFEQAVKEAFIAWSAERGTTWDRVGRWWYKEDEIDLVALSFARNETLLCEMKWSKKPVSRKVVESLIEKAGRLRWGTADRMEKYLVVARGGFSPACKRLMESEGILHWELGDLSRILWGK